MQKLKKKLNKYKNVNKAKLKSCKYITINDEEYVYRIYTYTYININRMAQYQV